MEEGFVNPTEGAENMNPEILQAFVEADAEHQAAVFGADEKTDPEPADGLADHIMETPEDYPEETVTLAKARKGRKKLPGNSTGLAAIVNLKEELQEADSLYLEGKSYDLDRIDNEVSFYQDKAGESLLEIGKRLILVKLHEDHGRFLAFLEKHGMGSRTAQFAMAATRKFSNTKSISYLGSTKMIALSILDDDDVQKLAEGGAVAGMKLDDIDRMTTRELRTNLRKAEEKIKKEKEARQKDRAAFEQSMLQKDAKLNELDMRLAGQEPPTKEQIAKTVVDKMTAEYTIAVAKANTAIREAYALVVKAEKIDGVNVQQLSEWLNQFSPDMQTFNDLVQTWLDEVDHAGPIEDWKLSDLPGGEAQA